MNEKSFNAEVKSAATTNWYLDFSAAPGASLPFKDIAEKQLTCSFENMPYSVKADKGSFIAGKSNTSFWVKPSENMLVLDLGEREN